MSSATHGWLTALSDAAPAAVKARLAEDQGLAAALQERLEAAARAWPQLSIEPGRFAAYVGARLPETPDLGALLPGLWLDDLYLACGCVLEVPRAAAEFERRHAADVRRGLGTATDALDEIRQDVLRHVLVGQPSRPARISAYTGRGSLGRWVSVVARRRLIDLGRSGGPSDARLSHASGLVAAYGDPELAMAHGALHSAVRDAIERVTGSLEARDRNTLRYVYVHKVRIREVAAIYRVDPSTIKRRLARIRRHLGDEVRDELRRTLGLDEAQLDAELAELPAALPITLSRILQAQP